MYRLCREQPPPRYHYLTLPNRVRGLALAATELVDMHQERRLRRGVHLISQRLEHLLRTDHRIGAPGDTPPEPQGIFQFRLLHVLR